MFFSIGDGFAAKINTDGSQLMYSTYVGGREDDLVLSLAVDAQGFAYLAGGTRSNNFPVTPNALQSVNRGSGGENRYPSGDGFVVKLNANGSGAEYSTYLGGVADDRAVGIAVDREGNAWVTGHTLSTDFPVTSDAQQRTFGGLVTAESITFGDAFLTKLHASGSRMLYSSYYGGAGNEVAHDAVLTADGSVIVSGMTSSRNLATTPGVFQPQGGVGDPQVAPFNDMFVLKVGEPPAIPPVSISSVRNEASQLGDAIAPGMVVTITGANLSSVTETPSPDSAGGRYPIEVGGTRVMVGDIPAPLLSVGPSRIVAVIPFAAEPGSEVALVVEASRDNRSPARTLAVVEAQPGLYSEDGSGSGGSRSLNEDGSVNGEGSAARPGTVLTLSGTGAGRTDPPSEDGAIATSETLHPLALQAAAVLGDMEAEVVRAGLLEGQVTGRFALQIRIPEGLPEGWYPLRLRLGADLWSQPEFYIYAGAPTMEGTVKRKPGPPR
jgi:uncharacterized protein (TIGR03437 family)